MAAGVLTAVHAFDSVVTVAPPTSLYGYSVGVLVPALLGLRCQHDRFGLGGLTIPGGMPLIVMLPPIPTWRRLERAHDPGARSASRMPVRGSPTARVSSPRAA